MPLAPGTRLGPYGILAPLGSGGMGEVYRAHDSRLGRDVAIKVLPAALSGDPDRIKRFEQEARAAGALNHPNIIAIYDVGIHGGSPFVVTELLQGETLRGRMLAAPIPVPRATDYAAQAARGLAAAHAKGIVHRDIKPENLFITGDGRLKILDFGLAKLTAPQHESTEATHTQTVAAQTAPGETWGTVGYMSPEQLRGDSVDHRSDIFAFGAVLYEVLAGCPAFKAASVAETMSAILNSAPPQVSEQRQISRGVERVIRRCLEKEPEARFQSARDLAFCLEGELLDLTHPEQRAGVQVSGAISERGEDAPSIAALPFDDLSPSKDSEYFSHGLTEEITARLSKLQSLHVLSRPSAVRLRAAVGDTVAAARAAGVDYVLEGSVRKAENALRITAQLIHTSADRQVWSETYRGTLDDIFDIQEKVASEIAAALSLKLSPLESAALSRRPTNEPGAFDLTLRGRYHLRAGTLNDLEAAIGLFRDAIARDPRYAEAYAGAAEAYATLFEFYDPSTDWLRQAVEAGAKAVLYDANLPDAYAALGLAHFNKGEVEDAMAACRRAIELKANDFIGYWIMGRIHYVTGRHREAAGAMQRVIELNPDYYPAYFMLRMLYRSLGERTYQDSILPRVVGEILPGYLQRHPQDARARNSYGTELSHAGRIAEGQVEVEKALGQAPDDPLIRYATACYHACFGDKDEALRMLKKAVEAGFRNLRYMKLDPDLEALRDDPAYLEIIGESEQHPD